MARYLRFEKIDLTGRESGIPVTAADVVAFPDTVGAGGQMLVSDGSGALGWLTAGAFEALPAAPVEGMLASVTDSNTATWGATVAAGGANHVLAYYNGTNWTVAGK